VTATNQVPPSGGEPFNHDGFWKAIYVDPNGELQSMSVLAIVAEIVEGPPHFFVWAYDTVVDCESLPGWVCAIGSPEPLEACYDSARRNLPDRIAAWQALFARRRSALEGWQCPRLPRAQ